MSTLISDLRGALIVSCQAPRESPLRDPAVMGRIASAVVLGGAAAIRANSPADVAAIRRSVDVPIIGLWKRDLPGCEVRITPELADAAALQSAGADMIALDATGRLRPGGVDTASFIQRIRDELGCPILADVDSLDAALSAVAAGADAVATTLAGYTHAGPVPDGPDIELVARIARAVPNPVLAEGRYRTAGQLRAAFSAGAHSVIVGAAVTDPIITTRRLTEGLPGRDGNRSAI
jgi:N-acylglucosamine-6-phosphate 2-epimerase